MFYHISSQGNLKELIPHKSTHGKEWVYALNDANIGLIFAGIDYFGLKADDHNTRYGTKDGIPEVFELYPNCLDEILKGRSCYIYTLEDSGFKANQTTWTPEFVSENVTKIISQRHIPDILQEIKKLAKNGKYIIHYYEDTPEYKQFVHDKIEKMYADGKKRDWIRAGDIYHYYDIVKNYVDNTMKEDKNNEFKNLTPAELNDVLTKNSQSKNKGWIRKELIYYYPEQVHKWINDKYEIAKTKNQDLAFNG